MSMNLSISMFLWRMIINILAPALLPSAHIGWSPGPEPRAN